VAWLASRSSKGACEVHRRGECNGAALVDSPRVNQSEGWCAQHDSNMLAPSNARSRLSWITVVGPHDPIVSRFGPAPQKSSSWNVVDGLELDDAYLYRLS